MPTELAPIDSESSESQQQPDEIEQDDSVLGGPQPQSQPPDIDPNFQSVNQTDQQQQQQAALAALSQTTLNPEQATMAGLSNLESRKALTQQQADVASAGAQNEADIQAQAAAEQKQQILAGQVAMQQAMQDANRRDNDLRSAIMGMGKEQVDPNHWWNSKSTSAKVAANIGILLGGIGQGLMVNAGAANAKNEALAQINRSIDQDIDAQKENIGNHFKQLMMTHDIDDTAFNRSLHEQEWRNNYRVAGLEAVKMQLSSNAANTNNKLTQLNAQQAIQDISKQQDDLRQQNWQYRQKLLASQFAGQAAKDKELQAEQKEANQQVMDLMNNSDHPMSEADARQVVGRLHPQLVQYGRFQAGRNGDLGSPMTNTPTTKAQSERELQADKDARERTVMTPQGPMMANNKESANDAMIIMRANENMDKSLSELEALQKKYETGTLSYSDIQRWKTIRGDITNKYNETYGVKRQSGMGEGTRIEEDILPEPPTFPQAGPTIAGHPTQFGLIPKFNPNVGASRAKLQQFRSLVKNNMDATLSQLSAVPGQAPKPQGDGIDFRPRAPVARPTGPAPQPIPNIQGTNGPANPGIPSFQQYRQGQQ